MRQRTWLLLIPIIACGAAIPPLPTMHGNALAQADPLAKAPDECRVALPEGAIAQLGDARMRVFGSAATLDFSPDGKLLAAGTRNGRFVFVWDVQTGRELRRLPVSELYVQAVDFTADGRELHCLHRDAWLRWNVSDWKPLPRGKLADDDSRTDRNPYLHAHGRRYGQLYNRDEPSIGVLDLATNQTLFNIPRLASCKLHFARNAHVAVMWTGASVRSPGHFEVWDIAEQRKLREFGQQAPRPAHMELSSDGKRMYVDRYLEESVEAWDLENGELLGNLVSQTRVSGLKLTPDDKKLMIWIRGGKTLLMDVATRRVEQTVELGIGLITFSRDGKLAAVGGAGNVVHLWDLETGKLRFPSDGPSHWIGNPAAANADEHVVVSVGGSTDESVGVWDTAKRKWLYRVGLPESRRFRVSPDGRWIATTEKGGNVCLWPIDDPEAMRRLPRSTPTRLVVTSTRDGAILATGCASGLVEISTFRPLPGGVPHGRLNLSGHIGPLLALAFADDNQTLASFGDDKTLCIWDTSTGELLRKFDVDHVTSTIAISPTGALVAAGTEKQVTVLNVAEGTVTARQEVSGPVVGLAFSADGKTLAAIRGGDVMLWDSRTGRQIAKHALPDVSLAALDHSPDGKLLAAAGSDAKVHLLDANKLTPQGQLACEDAVTALRFGVDAGRLLVNTRQATLQVWDVTTRQRRRKYPGLSVLAMSFARGVDRCVLLTSSRVRREVDLGLDHVPSGVVLNVPGTAGDCDFSPDSRRLAAVTPSAARVWDIASGENIMNLVGEGRFAEAVAFSPTGDSIATGGEGIAVWNLDTRVVGVAISPQRAGEIHALVFSPDGSMLASRDRRGNICLWESATGRLISAVYVRGGNYTRRPAFSADGRVLVAIVSTAEPGVTRRVTGWDAFTGRPVWHLADDPLQTVSCAIGGDGRTLLTGDRFGLTTIWDWERLMEIEFGPPGDGDPMPVEDCWRTLGSPDPRAAYRAVFALAARPQEALGLVQQVEFEAAPIGDTQIAAWIDQLDVNDAAVRRQASSMLLRSGEQACPLLRRALEEGPSIAARLRITILLAARTETVAHLQTLRIVHLLERIGTDEACKQLDRIASEGPTKLVRSHATAARRRIQQAIQAKTRDYEGLRAGVFRICLGIMNGGVLHSIVCRGG